MKFGIFYELQLPRPWEQDGERQLEELDATPFRERFSPRSVQLVPPSAAAVAD